MATTGELAELFKAIASEDWAVAKRTAGELCANAERKGHRGAARVLRGALGQNGTINGHTSRDTTPVAASSVSISGALTLIESPLRLDEVTLRAPTRKLISEIVREAKSRESLRAVGLKPRTKLLFHGPPGCGKSLTAAAFGKELVLPTFIVRFDAIVGAYLGQTAIHLRQLFHFAETVPSVLVFDEIDALGNQRGNPRDIGELDRIVISLMQELEHSQPLGAIIATSNLPQILDEALWRRFDVAIAFPAPTKRELMGFSRKLANRRGVRMSSAVQKKVASKKSYADVVQIIDSVARLAILEQI